LALDGGRLSRYFVLVYQVKPGSMKSGGSSSRFDLIFRSFSAPEKEKNKWWFFQVLEILIIFISHFKYFLI
jgi:hypothetical protein